ncbi:TrgA family protein [Yoonia sp.]|uniref:TrgA family protein n=1 Tax=Yoonia sp. TaxID=2212373 RepID=UPI0035C7C0E2
MPTAARLAGAIVFAVLGLYLALLSTNLFPNERAPDYWYPLLVGVGVAVGWKFCGGRAGKGYSASFGLGITTSLCIAFWVAFLVGMERMISNALDMEYGGVMNAIMNVFVEMSLFAEDMFDITLLINLFVGGIIGAFLVEIVARRLP